MTGYTEACVSKLGHCLVGLGSLVFPSSKEIPLSGLEPLFPSSKVVNEKMTTTNLSVPMKFFMFSDKNYTIQCCIPSATPWVRVPLPGSNQVYFGPDKSKGHPAVCVCRSFAQWCYCMSSVIMACCVLFFTINYVVSRRGEVSFDFKNRTLPYPRCIQNRYITLSIRLQGK